MQGTSAKIDLAIRLKPEIDAFLKQSVEENIEFDTMLEALQVLGQKITA